MVIGTALGFSDWGTVGLAVALAFLFGYTPDQLPAAARRDGAGCSRTDRARDGHVSIAIMEIVDNALIS